MSDSGGWREIATPRNLGIAAAALAITLGAASFADRGKPFKPHPYLVARANAAPAGEPKPYLSPVRTSAMAIGAPKPLPEPIMVRDSPIAAEDDGATPAAHPVPAGTGHVQGDTATPAAQDPSPATSRAPALPGSPEFWGAVSQAGYGASIALEIGPDGARAGKTVILTCRAELGACPKPPQGDGLRVVYRDRKGVPYKSDADRRADWR